MTGFVFCGLTILLANVVLVHSAPKAQSHLPQLASNEAEQHSDSYPKCYSVPNIFWPRRNITYRISQHSMNLPVNVVEAQIAEAFAKWSDFGKLNITRKESNGVDIDIRFVKANENDDSYDQEGKSYGRGKYELHRYVYFDDTDNWTLNNTIEEKNFFQTALLLTGHALGLILPRKRNYEIDLPDCASELAKEELCKNPKIDTIFTDYRGNTLIFKRDRYFQFNKTDLAKGHSKLISERWSGLPGNIDAAFTHKKTNHTFFFKNTTVWRYTMDILDPDFPQDIRAIFGDKFTHFDDIVYRKNKLFIFVDDSYWVYSYHKNKLSQAKSIRQLRFPPNIDAAFESPDGYTYFFKDDKFYTLNFHERNINKKEFIVPLFPQSTSQIFLGCKP